MDITVMGLLGVLLGSSVLSAVVTQCGAYVLDRRKRKDTIEDKDSEEESKLMAKLVSIESGISSMKEQLEKHIQENEFNIADQARARILRFADDFKGGSVFSQEHWDQIMNDVDVYEGFCRDNEKYPNSKAVATIAYLREEYNVRVGVSSQSKQTS